MSVRGALAATAVDDEAASAAAKLVRVVARDAMRLSPHARMTGVQTPAATSPSAFVAVNGGGGGDAPGVLVAQLATGVDVADAAAEACCFHRGTHFGFDALLLAVDRAGDGATGDGDITSTGDALGSRSDIALLRVLSGRSVGAASSAGAAIDDAQGPETTAAEDRTEEDKDTIGRA